MEAISQYSTSKRYGFSNGSAQAVSHASQLVSVSVNQSILGPVLSNVHEIWPSIKLLEMAGLSGICQNGNFTYQASSG